MTKIADVKAFNSAFADMIEEGSVKEASVSTQSYTRDKLREESFAEKIITPIDIANDELDKAQDTQLLVKWNDREPDSAPATIVPYGVVPGNHQFKGTRYPSYFSRIVSDKESKDVDQLRSYDYDIRAVLMEQHVKNIAQTIDSTFITTVNNILGLVNTANPLNTLGLPQWVTMAGGITRENFAEAIKVIQRLRVPFGPLQPDGSESKGVILLNNVTAQDFVKMSRSEVGGDLAQQTWIDGLPSKSLLGLKPIYTIKRDLVPDGTVYFFSAEEFFGKYYRLQPLTVFMKTEAFFLEFFQYMNISLSIGNVKGVTRVDFTG